MKTQTIRFCDVKRNVLHRPTAYRLRKDLKRFNWFFDFLWRVLEKSGALKPHMEEISSWTYTPQKAKPVNKAFESAIGSIHRSGLKSEDFAFVIGSKEFNELTSAPFFKQMVTFETGDFGYCDGYQWRYFGVPIHVVPQLSGIAAIPKVAIEGRGRGGRR